MTTFVGNSTYIRAGIEELEEYLQSDVLYWRLSGSGTLSRLTLGGLLLGLAVERGSCTSPRDEVELDRLIVRLDAIHARWQAAWEQKSRQEVPARLNQWKQFLSDLGQNPQAHAVDYPQEVKRRAMLQLLFKNAPLLQEEWGMLVELDRVVKFILVPGEFIWEKNLAPVFPEPEFWFLYGMMKS